MSSRPKWSWACLTAAKSASRSVTSSWIGSSASPYLSDQVVQRRGVARGGGDLVAALQRGDRPLPSEAARRTGDEPNFFRHALPSCAHSRSSPRRLPIPGSSTFTGSVDDVNRATLDKDPREVASMFDGVARRYDITNTVLSLGQDRFWRRATRIGAAHRAGRQGARPGRGHRGVDGRAGQSGAWCVAADFSVGMLGRRACPRRCRRWPATRPGCRSPTTCSTR